MCVFKISDVQKLLKYRNREKGEKETLKGKKRTNDAKRKVRGVEKSWYNLLSIEIGYFNLTPSNFIFLLKKKIFNFVLF